VKKETPPKQAGFYISWQSCGATVCRSLNQPAELSVRFAMFGQILVTLLALALALEHVADGAAWQLVSQLQTCQTPDRDCRWLSISSLILRQCRISDQASPSCPNATRFP
jgi:hypothetical protein